MNLSFQIENSLGQLGTGNTTNFKVPQKILNIPPVLFVSCGSEHTLINHNRFKFVVMWK